MLNWARIAFSRTYDAFFGTYEGFERKLIASVRDTLRNPTLGKEDILDWSMEPMESLVWQSPGVVPANEEIIVRVRYLGVYVVVKQASDKRGGRMSHERRST